MRWSRLFVGAWIASAVLMIAGLPWLPEQVGDPGKTLRREAFVGIMLFALANAALCSAGFVGWLGRGAPQLINLPHRDYWLAPERRNATLARLGEHLSALGLLVLALLDGLYVQHVLQAQAQWPQPPKALWAVGGLGLAAAFGLWCWRVHRMFPAPKNDSATPSPQPPRRRPRRPGEPR